MAQSTFLLNKGKREVKVLERGKREREKKGRQKI